MNFFTLNQIQAELGGEIFHHQSLGETLISGHSIIIIDGEMYRILTKSLYYDHHEMWAIYFDEFQTIEELTVLLQTEEFDYHTSKIEQNPIHIN